MKTVNKKFIITSVQYGAVVNKNLLTNMLLFAKKHKVENIYTFVMNGRYKDDDVIDQSIGYAGISIIETLKLNLNLKCKDMKVLAQQINPFTGIGQKLSRDYSYILPSAKIRYISLANTSKHPRAIMSTGSLTHGNYKENAIGKKAYNQHQYGFVYVEVVNNKIFHAYQVEATRKGDFHYMDEKYHTGFSSYSQPEALILGDWHTGFVDSYVRKETISMIDQLKPKRVVFHDIMDSLSINPHEFGNLLSELRNFQQKRNTLEKELLNVYKEICFFAKEFPKVQFLVPESNHDLFLKRYIDSKQFMYNPQNFLLVVRMLPEMLKENEPTLKIALSMFGKIPTNFKFFKEDDEYRVHGIELAVHGHRGPNGSRGGSFERLNLRMITGHTHTPSLHSTGMVVGTSTLLKLPYTKGPSSWMHAHGILYSDGKYGLITIIK